MCRHPVIFCVQMSDAERLAAVEGCKFVDKVRSFLRRVQLRSEQARW